MVARCFEYELARLNSPECYFNSISAEFLEKRDKIVKVLKECSLKPVVPDGGYFILINYNDLGMPREWNTGVSLDLTILRSLAGDQFQSDEEDMKDFKFVRHLTKEKVNLCEAKRGH